MRGQCFHGSDRPWRTLAKAVDFGFSSSHRIFRKSSVVNGENPSTLQCTDRIVLRLKLSILVVTFRL